MDAPSLRDLIIADNPKPEVLRAALKAAGLDDDDAEKIVSDIERLKAGQEPIHLKKEEPPTENNL